MSTPIFPPVAGFDSDTRNPPSWPFIGECGVTNSYTMPANTLVAQYELVRIVGGAVAKIAAGPAAGDIVRIAMHAADNLTATAAELRVGKLSVAEGPCVVDPAKITIPSGTATDWKAVASGCGISFKDPQIMPGV